MIQDGVALMRLSGTAHGAGGMIEEFYVVVSEGLILPTRYRSYADAFRKCERLFKETRANVA
jgi:hypothetical protein